MATCEDIRTYGNWRKPTSPGIGGLGLVGTAVLFGGLLLVIFTMAVSWLLALVIGILFTLSLIPLLMRDKHGRNGLQWGTARASWAKGVSSGQHLYRSGPLGRVPLGTCKLPGLLAGSKLYEAQDAYGRPFAHLHVPSTNHHTVVLTCNADGASLVDPLQVETWVAYWGHWLSQLGHEPSLVAASVTVEAAPDTGERLREEVESNLVPGAPALAQAVLREVVNAYPAGSASLSTRIALTYSGASRTTGVRRTPDDVAVEIGTRLPGLCAGLQMTGAGPARPMTGQELIEAVRVAYDPSVAVYIDQARAAGEDTGLSWDEAGPIAGEEAWGHYRHDDAFSVTWSMSEAPRGAVFSNSLSRLVAPHPDILRKRVTLLYRPHDPATAARLVERDRKDALFKAKQSKTANARDSVAVRAAEQAAQEEATGAGLVRFGMLVTATVASAAELKLAASAMDELSASARVLMRRVYGSQAAAFAAALPVGLVIPSHLKVPATIREAM